MSNPADNLHKPEIEQKDAAWQDQAAITSEQALVELKLQYDELEDKYKRLWADQQNMLNRFNRERQDLIKYAATNTVDAILPALDNFDFAKKSITANTSHQELIKSFEMLQEQLLMSLKAVGLEEIATNILYDPALHEAVSSVEDATQAEGTILEVIKKGFKLQDRILRPATVVVTKKSA
jgi:molecular chaperone GrpE